LAGHIGPDIRLIRLEIPEVQGAFLEVVVSVGIPHSMRIDLETRAYRNIRCSRRPSRPLDRTPQRLLEALNHKTGDGIDHLLVKPEVQFGGLDAAQSQKVASIQVNRRVSALFSVI